MINKTIVHTDVVDRGTPISKQIYIPITDILAMKTS